MYNSGETTSNRRMPEEWPELVSVAYDALPTTGSFPKESPAELHAMMTRVAEWDRTKLDQNRFYAYSQLLCEVARPLADPMKRDRLIKAGAKSLLEWSSEDSGGKGSNGGISGLRHNSVALPFRFLITNAYDSLPLGAELAGDLLTVASARRVNIKPSPAEITAQISEATRARGSRMVDHIDNIMTGATTNLLDTVLMAVSPGYRDGEVPNEQAMKLLRHPRLPQIAQHACGLLLGDTTGQASFIRVEEDDIVFVNPNHVTINAESETATLAEDTVDNPAEIGFLSLLGIDMEGEGQSPEPEEIKGYNSREQSIICPAANITGMVPGVVNMAVEMVEIAVEELKATDQEHSNLLSV